MNIGWNPDDPRDRELMAKVLAALEPVEKVHVSAADFVAALLPHLTGNPALLLHEAVTAGTFQWGDIAATMGIDHALAIAYNRNLGRTVRWLNNQMGTDFKVIHWESSAKAYVVSARIRTAIQNYTPSWGQ
jgi:hypothetical protein